MSKKCSEFVEVCKISPPVLLFAPFNDIMGICNSEVNIKVLDTVLLIVVSACA